MTFTLEDIARYLRKQPQDRIYLLVPNACVVACFLREELNTANPECGYGGYTIWHHKDEWTNMSYPDSTIPRYIWRLDRAGNEITAAEALRIAEEMLQEEHRGA
jgi:hypothetical protein